MGNLAQQLKNYQRFVQSGSMSKRLRSKVAAPIFQSRDKNKDSGAPLLGYLHTYLEIRLGSVSLLGKYITMGKVPANEESRRSSHENLIGDSQRPRWLHAEGDQGVSETVGGEQECIHRMDEDEEGNLDSQQNYTHQHMGTRHSPDERVRKTKETFKLFQSSVGNSWERRNLNESLELHKSEDIATVAKEAQVSREPKRSLSNTEAAAGSEAKAAPEARPTSVTNTAMLSTNTMILQSKSASTLPDQGYVGGTSVTTAVQDESETNGDGQRGEYENTFSNNHPSNDLNDLLLEVSKLGNKFEQVKNSWNSQKSYATLDRSTGEHNRNFGYSVQTVPMKPDYNPYSTLNKVMHERRPNGFAPSGHSAHSDVPSSAVDHSLGRFGIGGGAGTVQSQVETSVDYIREQKEESERSQRGHDDAIFSILKESSEDEAPTTDWVNALQRNLTGGQSQVEGLLQTATNWWKGTEEKLQMGDYISPVSSMLNWAKMIRNYCSLVESVHAKVANFTLYTQTASLSAIRSERSHSRQIEGCTLPKRLGQLESVARGYTSSRKTKKEELPTIYKETLGTWLKDQKWRVAIELPSLFYQQETDTGLKRHRIVGSLQSKISKKVVSAMKKIQKEYNDWKSKNLVVLGGELHDEVIGRLCEKGQFHRPQRALNEWLNGHLMIYLQKLSVLGSGEYITCGRACVAIGPALLELAGNETRHASILVDQRLNLTNDEGQVLGKCDFKVTFGESADQSNTSSAQDPQTMEEIFEREKEKPSPLVERESKPSEITCTKESKAIGQVVRRTTKKHRSLWDYCNIDRSIFKGGFTVVSSSYFHRLKDSLFEGDHQAYCVGLNFRGLRGLSPRGYLRNLGKEHGHCLRILSAEVECHLCGPSPFDGNKFNGDRLVAVLKAHPWKGIYPSASSRPKFGDMSFQCGHLSEMLLYFPKEWFELTAEDQFLECAYLQLHIYSTLQFDRKAIEGCYVGGCRIPLADLIGLMEQALTQKNPQRIIRPTWCLQSLLVTHEDSEEPCGYLTLDAIVGKTGINNVATGELHWTAERIAARKIQQLFCKPRYRCELPCAKQSVSVPSTSAISPPAAEAPTVSKPSQSPVPQAEETCTPQPSIHLMPTEGCKEMPRRFLIRHQFHLMPLSTCTEHLPLEVDKGAVLLYRFPPNDAPSIVESNIIDSTRSYSSSETLHKLWWSAYDQSYNSSAIHTLQLLVQIQRLDAADITEVVEESSRAVLDAILSKKFDFNIPVSALVSNGDSEAETQFLSVMPQSTISNTLEKARDFMMEHPELVISACIRSHPQELYSEDRYIDTVPKAAGETMGFGCQFALSYRITVCQSDEESAQPDEQESRPTQTSLRSVACQTEIINGGNLNHIVDGRENFTEYTPQTCSTGADSSQTRDLTDTNASTVHVANQPICDQETASDTTQVREMHLKDEPEEITRLDISSVSSVESSADNAGTLMDCDGQRGLSEALTTCVDSYLSSQDAENVCSSTSCHQEVDELRKVFPENNGIEGSQNAAASQGMDETAKHVCPPADEQLAKSTSGTQERHVEKSCLNLTEQTCYINLERIHMGEWGHHMLLSEDYVYIELFVEGSISSGLWWKTASIHAKEAITRIACSRKWNALSMQQIFGDVLQLIVQIKRWNEETTNTHQEDVIVQFELDPRQVVFGSTQFVDPRTDLGLSLSFKSADSVAVPSTAGNWTSLSNYSDLSNVHKEHKQRRESVTSSASRQSKAISWFESHAERVTRILGHHHQ